ncbi:MAG: PAS domain S-box protein [Pirellulaceae bacterium]
MSNPQESAANQPEGPLAALRAQVAELQAELESEREQAGFYRQVLESVPEYVVTIGPDLRFTYVNQQTDDYPDSMVGVHLSDVVVSDDMPLFEQQLRRVFERGETVLCEGTGIQDGRLYESHFKPIYRNGNVVLAVANSRDITEHKKLQAELTQQRDELERRVAERTSQLATINDRLYSDIQRREEVESQLRESEERFRTMAEGSPVPVVISDPETGQVFYGNHRLAEMFRTPYETLTEQTTTDFYLHPEQREELVARMRAEGLVNGAEIQLKRADGTPLWAAVYNRTITYNGQQALLACFLDTTAWKAAEEALLKDRRLLRRLLDLNERDRQLIAYEIHDGVVQHMSGSLMFLESASHQLLTEGTEIAELTKACQLLRDGVDEARRIIDGLRPPVLEEAGIIAAVENLVEESNELGPLDIKWTHSVHFDRLAPPIEMAIYRIVQEGVNNARQHSGGGNIWVSITQQWTYIYISIRDDGCGFDPKVTKKRRYGLQGIHERARLLGGSEIIDTELGGGTEIRVTLPISDALLPPEE